MSEEAPRRTDRQPPGMPRWVKITGLVVGVLILVIVLVTLTGLAGDHGPARHLSGTGSESATLVSGRLPAAAST